ncbi:MAG: class I tRNA ligase family protein, partial [Candidatus Micrarchaeia archaeon]
SITIDWPISKRRYYATEVPLWYCEKCGWVCVPQKGRYHQPWRERAPVDKCPKCGSTNFRGETRVFDTWFDSSISPLYILQYSRNNSFFEKAMPCTLRPQGKEIVRTWLYYTLLKCYLLTGRPIFKEVFINYHIVDSEGEKMSKSKGNVIDPQDVIKMYGAEPLRLWAAVEGNLDKQDFRCSYSRIAGAAKTLVKLWNVAKFISMFPKVEKDISEVRLMDTDKWIIHEVNGLVKQASERYARYDFHNPVIGAKHFIWETFASHYLELVKNRAYNTAGSFTKEEQEAAIFTLHYCLERILRILAPVIPIITAKIYKDIYDKDVHFMQFPCIETEFSPQFTTQELEELNSMIWKRKRESGLSLRAELKELQIPEKFKTIKKDIANAHNVKLLNYASEVRIVLA